MLAHTFSGNDYRVLLGVLAYCERANYLHVSVAEMARRLTMPYGSCLKSWKVLMRDDWLREEVNEYGRLVSYRLSPYLCWRGRPWKALVARQQWDAARKLVRFAGEED